MKKIVKALFLIGLFSILIGLIILRKDSLITLFNAYIFPNNKVVIDKTNSYYRDYNFLFVQNINDKIPSNYQDLLNVYYTVINSGKDEYSFYCPKSYKSCITEVEKIANDQTLLSNINNYVHPYNAFNHIETEYDTLGKVTIKIERPYTDDDIQLINKKVDELYDELYDENKTIKENIETFHDYIINNTKYDSDKSDKNISYYKSDTAYGPLFEGYAICGGYTDLMQLFLEKMKLKSYRISSDMHIWNAVMIDNKWYHIDLTWDDPITSDGKNNLIHSYMLIDTNKLLNSSKDKHDFDQNVFLELKETN